MTFNSFFQGSIILEETSSKEIEEQCVGLHIMHFYVVVSSVIFRYVVFHNTFKVNRKKCFLGVHKKTKKDRRLSVVRVHLVSGLWIVCLKRAFHFSSTLSFQLPHREQSNFIFSTRSTPLNVCEQS